ncbi:hypothetical protein B484DRAFT_450537 [Ochromonadaceae sp. CCMP2298]|nr:hypothetical protein B484DRAFT_450537 [Ochromonadaceae sp. CCMP2298]
MESSTAGAACAAAAAVAVAAYALRSSKIRGEGGSKEGRANLGRIDQVSLPVGAKWVDLVGFQVIAAICDAFLPTLRAEDLTEEALRQAMDSTHQEMSAHGALTPAAALQFKAYLCRGALDEGIPAAVCDAIQSLVSPQDQAQIYIVLRALSTGVGCFLLTGCPVPFHQLPLQRRVAALGGLRDSSLAPLRVVFQTFKRLTLNRFFGKAPHGGVNPAWADLHYDPQQTVSQGSGPSAQEQREDAVLRERVTYAASMGEMQGIQRMGAEKGGGGEEAFDEVEVDVVVVGSGSGGGMAAAQLAQAGLRVLVMEKGGYYRRQEFAAWREGEAYNHAFEKGGFVATAEGSVLVLAGSCVGGGSTINWSASFRTPDFVTADWASQGMAQFGKGGAFSQSLDAVHSLLGINHDNSHRDRQEQEAAKAAESTCGTKPFAVNRNNGLLWESAQKMGYCPEKIPRNVKGCVDCGHCCNGCPYGAKQSTPTALLEPLLLECAAAREAGDRGGISLAVIPHCHVDKVLYEKGEGGLRAVGVEATVRVMKSAPGLGVSERLQQQMQQKADPHEVRRLRVKAAVVVCAAGALHTPALLLRSGLKGAPADGAVGAHLALHPVCGVGGVFPEEKHTGLASGVGMGVVVRHPVISAATVSHQRRPAKGPAQTDAQREAQAEDDMHPLALQTPPTHPGLMGLFYPWGGKTDPSEGGLATKIGMLSWRHSGIFIFISRDRSQRSNRISIDPQGQPVLHYTVQTGKGYDDEAMLLAGVETNLRCMRAGGARFLFLAHESLGWHFCGQAKGEGPEGEERRFEEYLAVVRREGVQVAKMQVFSAHQMSSCRMAPCKEQGPTSPTGELFECQRLFLADASVFPTSLGINPMVTVEAFAHMIAGNVLQQLRAGDSELRGRVDAFRARRNKQW